MANQGNVDAQVYLGIIFDESAVRPRKETSDPATRVRHDDKDAARWFRLAEDHGNADAQANLGMMYEEGDGVAQDYKEALRWYRLAADNGNPDAQTRLGFMHWRGRGVPQDYKEAVRWFRLSGKQGESNRDLLEILNLGRWRRESRCIPPCLARINAAS